MNQRPEKKKPAARGPFPKELKRPAPEAPVNEIAALEEKVAQLSFTNRQLKRKIFDLYTVFEINRNFNAVLDYKMLLDTFIFTCLGQVGALKGAIFLKSDAETDGFQMVKAKGSGALPEPETVLVESSRLCGYLTKLNRPVLIAEITPEICTNEEREILTCFEKGVSM